MKGLQKVTKDRKGYKNQKKGFEKEGLRKKLYNGL